MTNKRTGEYSYQHGRMDALMPVAEQFGVQPWSQGPLYPCVITVIERYDELPPRYAFVGVLAYEAYLDRTPLAARLRSRSYELTLDGHSDEYASREDAEQVARALIGSPFLRAQWNQSEDFSGAEVADCDGEQRCTSPLGHKFECTGTQYGGNDDRWHGEGRCLCIYCGADGDA